MALQILIMKFNSISSSFKIIKLATAMVPPPGCQCPQEGKEGHTDAEQRKSIGVSSSCQIVYAIIIY
jgi:hypothetical protein